jgi:hypothetical protein
MFMRLLSFLTTTYTVTRIRDMVLREERLLAELMILKQQLEGLKQPGDSFRSDDDRDLELFR